MNFKRAILESNIDLATQSVTLPFLHSLTNQDREKKIAQLEIEKNLLVRPPNSSTRSFKKVLLRNFPSTDDNPLFLKTSLNLFENNNNITETTMDRSNNIGDCQSLSPRRKLNILGFDYERKLLNDSPLLNIECLYDNVNFITPESLKSDPPSPLHNQRIQCGNIRGSEMEQETKVIIQYKENSAGKKRKREFEPIMQSYKSLRAKIKCSQTEKPLWELTDEEAKLRIQRIRSNRESSLQQNGCQIFSSKSRTCIFQLEPDQKLTAVNENICNAQEYHNDDQSNLQLDADMQMNSQASAIKENLQIYDITNKENQDTHNLHNNEHTLSSGLHLPQNQCFLKHDADAQMEISNPLHQQNQMEQVFHESQLLNNIPSSIPYHPETGFRFII